MKTKTNGLIILTLAFIISSMTSYAQNYGNDSTRCVNELSNYTEYYKQKQYKDAYHSWAWCYKNCPQSIINIYIQGPTIIEDFINSEEDSLKRERWIDTLMQVFDDRIKYFGQEGYVLGLKALAMINYRNNDIQATYNVLKSSYELQKEATKYYVLSYYFTTTVVLYQNSLLTKEDVLLNYSNVMEVLNMQIQNENNERTKNAILAEAQAVEDLFINSGVADCESVIKLYEPKFAETPTDVELAKKIVALLNMGNSDECKLSDLYLKAATLIFENEKSASSAHSIAQSYLKRKEYATADNFYIKAIELESDLKKKADMYHEQALGYYLSNNYPSARNAAKSAITCDAACGKAYILIAKIYGITAKNCTDNEFEKKVANCLVVDWLTKAKAADPNVTAEANELIMRYASFFPKREEGFWLNIDTGAVVSFGCWINESTTVRFCD